MNLESDSGIEVRDRTPIVWIVVIGAFVVMVLAMWIVTRPSENVTTRAYVHHILFKYDDNDPADRERALQEAREIRQRIVEGEDFEKIAEQYSEDELTAERGGALGWVYPGILAVPVDEYIWTAPIGQVSDVLSTAHGFHLVMVKERSLSGLDQYEKSLRERAFGNVERAQEPVTP